VLRTTELHAIPDLEALDNFRQQHCEAFENALKYLSLWALTSYNHVSLMIASDFEITAVYSQRDDNGAPMSARKYVIGGIWHPEDGRYSFHS
jgi:hypothetical protein